MNSKKGFYKISAGLLVFVLFFSLGFLKPSTPRLKTSEEARVERAIERAYRLYFRTVSISGKKLVLRVPFGQENERLPGQKFFKGGKAAPWEIWPVIFEILESDDFKDYIEKLSRPGAKLVFLDLPKKEVGVIFDKEEIRRKKAQFLGNEIYPCEFKKEAGFSEIDIYNYLYTKGVGVDCSGFSFFVLRYIGFQYGVDLRREIEKESPYIGTWVYNPWNTEEVSDRIVDLRAGDVIVVHCFNRPNCHSLIIGNIDYSQGIITYYQCTDWVADRGERGPHRSKIFFDPTHPEMRLSDPEVKWEQRVGETFLGEGCPYQGQTDGYRFSIRKKGRIVRLKILADIIRQREPQYYTN